MLGEMQLGAGNRLSVPTVRRMLPKWATSKVEKMGKNGGIWEPGGGGKTEGKVG